VLVLRYDFNLIIAREGVHEEEDFASDTVIDEGGGEIVLRTSRVKVPIINTYLDRALILGDGYDIGDPFCKGHQIDKTSVQ
jgi:hypothetical protein